MMRVRPQPEIVVGREHAGEREEVADDSVQPLADDFVRALKDVHDLEDDMPDWVFQKIEAAVIRLQS